MATKKTMTVMVNGKPEQRDVDHERKNPKTMEFEQVPVLKVGEMTSKDENGFLNIWGGAHR